MQMATKGKSSAWREGPPIIKDGVINVSQLEAAIATAVRKDERYNLENDAKFRAVAQKVGSYEEFEDIVKASHMKPMTEDVAALSLSRSSWNPTGRTKQRMTEEVPTYISAAAIPVLPAKAITDREFVRAWKAFKNDGAKKFEYLISFKPSVLKAIFRSEISDGLLGDFLLALAQGPITELAASVLDLLTALASTGRFSLALEFLAQTERAAVSKIFSVLAAHADTKDRSDQIQSLYELGAQTYSTGND